MAYLSRCFRMDPVCVTYIRRIGPATYMILIFKCTHIKEYELPMLTYVLRTRDVPFVS